MYSFTLTIRVRSHDNMNNLISRLSAATNGIPLTEERYSLSPIQQPVVICQGDNHYRPYHNLSIHHNRAILGCVHPYHSACFIDRGVPSRHNISTYRAQPIGVG
jgi:hypothetical protein